MNPQRTLRVVVFLLLLMGLVVLDARAQWMPGGIPLAPGSGFQSLPSIAPNGEQGAFVAWRQRTKGNEDDVFLQQISNVGGLLSGWSPMGLLLATGPSYQFPLFTKSDGLGGAFVYWTDVNQSGYQLRVQRVVADGQIYPGWPELGVAVASAAAVLVAQGACSDGAGGVYIAWESNLGSSGVSYLQHLQADGTIAPGWPQTGHLVIDLPLTNSSAMDVIPDGAGGALLPCYAAGPNVSPETVLFVARYNADGTHPPGWPPAGVPVAIGARPSEHTQQCTDGAGGLYVAWNDWRNGPDPPNPSLHYDLYAQHILADGSMAPGWPLSGRVVSDAPNGQTAFDIAPDGVGGALIAWEDSRSGLRLYALRINADGTTPPGWAPLGNRLSFAPPAQYLPSLVADGQNGFYAFWEMLYNGVEGFYAQHMDGNGQLAPGWSAEGRLFVDPGSSFLSRLVVVSDDAGGAIGAFVRGDEIWAHRLYADGSTSTRPALVSAEAAAGEATLRWSISGESIRDPRVERRTESSEWTSVGGTTSLSPGLLEFVDRGLAPGRYGYRLSFVEEGIAGWSEATWLDVIGGIALALQGFRPNPSVGIPSVVLSLPDDRPAQVDVIDARGRIVQSREVGSLGGGSHVVALATEAALRPGMYWIRLTHPDRTMTTKGLVLR